MKRIVLTPELLRQQSQELSALTREYESLFSGVSGILSSLNGNWSANLANNFSSKVASAQASFSSITELLEQGASAAQTSADTFQSLDSLLAQNFGETTGTGVAQRASASSDGESWWYNLKKKAGHFASRVKDEIETGVAKVTNAISGGVSWFLEEYDKKGLLFKVVSTGVAVVSVAGAIASIVAVGALTAATGGATVPLLVLASAYSAFSIVDAIDDLYNCWGAYGDVNKVGHTHVGEDMLVDVLGENVGSTVYNMGSIVYMLTNVTAATASLVNSPAIIKDTVKEFLSQFFDSFNDGYFAAEEKAIAGS